MGFAKYHEDDLKIYDERMYYRNASSSINVQPSYSKVSPRIVYSFYCPFCKKGFVSLKKLIKHITSVHTVADELLYLYKNGEDPSAFFAVKVFLYLSQMETVEIESRNEFISSIENVDSIEYQEIDKSQIKATNIKKTVVQRKSIFKQPSKESKTENILRTSIDEINLTVRSYNCLKRAGINTVGDLVKKTSLELKKIRNLGVSNQTEIINRLHDLGLKLADGK